MDVSFPVCRGQTHHAEEPSILASAALFAAAAHAQCLNTTGGTPVTLVPTTTFAADDEGRSAPIALGFNFPIAGASSATFSHVVVDANGVAWLTNGGAAVGATDYGTADMAGAAGDSPRIAAFWTDLEGGNGGANWQVTVDTSVAGQFTINWIEINEYGNPGTFSVQARLTAGGDVSFTYSVGLTLQGFDTTVGVSPGNGVAGTSTDLSTLPTSSSSSLYEDLQSFDLRDQTLTFVPNGTGYTVVRTCGNQIAENIPYGEGCYDIPGSVYQLFTDAAAASAGLTGQSVFFLPNSTGYTMLWGGGTYVPPSGTATVLALSDDGEVLVNPSVALSTPFGPQTDLYVHGNGVLTLGLPQTFGGSTWDPTSFGFLNATETAFWAWHDYNVDEVGSGSIKYEEVGGIAYITWDGVENYPAGTVNPGTLQMQLDLASGLVTFVWPSVDSDTSSTFGSAHLVGFANGTNQLDPGSVDLATALPLSTFADVAKMTLSASPAPISTPTSGTTVVYQTDNIPEFAPGAGIYVAINALSLGGIPAPGVDLAIIGAPGCAGLIQTLDVIQNMVGVSPSQSVTFPIPAGVPAGTTIYSQSAALIQPNSLPNGQNAFGLTTSNGIQTIISTQ